MASKETMAKTKQVLPLPKECRLLSSSIGVGRTTQRWRCKRRFWSLTNGSSRTWLRIACNRNSPYGPNGEQAERDQNHPGSASRPSAQMRFQRMQMAADDSRRVVDEAQQMTQKIAKSLGNR